MTTAYATDTEADEELNVHETAAEMEVCAETVRRLIRAKQLRAVKAGTRGYRVRRSWIAEYRNNMTTFA